MGNEKCASLGTISIQNLRDEHWELSGTEITWLRENLPKILGPELEAVLWKSSCHS